jgi:hypothetical protein
MKQKLPRNCPVVFAGEALLTAVTLIPLNAATRVLRASAAVVSRILRDGVVRPTDARRRLPLTTHLDWPGGQWPPDRRGGLLPDGGQQVAAKPLAEEEVPVGDVRLPQPLVVRLELRVVVVVVGCHVAGWGRHFLLCVAGILINLWQY